MASFLTKLLKRMDKPTANSKRFVSLCEEADAAVAANDFDRAVKLYDCALSLDPSQAKAFYKRGNALRNLGRLREAIENYDKALELKPDYAHAYCNRGVVEHALGMTEKALLSYGQAISYDPGDAMTYYNRALLLQECARWDDVLADYQRAISIDPMFADAQYNRSLALLYCGEFERGWRSYEWRWKNAARIGIGTDLREFSRPLWLGEEALKGKTILLHCEAGLGDTLQFCRYVPLVAKLAATVYLEAPIPLMDFLASLQGDGVLLIPRGSELPDFDYHTPLLSLPLAFKTTLDTVPAPLRYLQSDEAKVRRWIEILKDAKRPLIGLAWSGNPRHTLDQRRSIRLADLVAHLPADIQYFRLQKDLREEDATTLSRHPNIRSKNADFQDFANIAALCECMDLVISVDTSLAHLSGALGKRTWILLPYIPDWRWLRNRDDSPWYPSVKLYRQRSPGDWHEVLTRVDNDLRREFLIA